jgi:hypothetical protein
MDPYNRGIDHLDIAVISLCDRVHDAIPDACLAPAVEAVVAGRIGPVALWQIPPGHARAQDPEDAVQDPPVVDPGHAPRLVGQQGLDHRPFEIGQIVASTHDPAPTVWKLESHPHRLGNPVYGYMA